MINLENLFKRSQKKIQDLKQKLQDINQRQNEILEEEKTITRSREKHLQEVKVILSIESIVKAAFAILMVIALVYLLSFMKSIIILFLVALFLAAAFNPGVDKLQKFKIPRWLGIILLYIIVLGLIVLIFAKLVPIIAQQISSLALSARDMIQNIVSGRQSDSWLVTQLQSLASEIWQNVNQVQILSTITNTLRDVASKLTDFAGNALGAIFAIFNGLLNLMLVLIITFFMILNKHHTNSFFHSLFPRRYSGYIAEKTGEISHRIGEWIRGQVLLAGSMMVFTFIVFSVMGLNYALTLSIVSGLAEFVPYLGPLVTFVSAVLIALNQDPALVLWLLPIYAFMQIIEGNVMVPLILGRSLGLNPIVVLFAVLAGATIGSQIGDGSVALGVIGMIIAVPIANIVSIFVEDYTGKNK